ncbi:hypothetical protein [Thalassotalea ganghwensis]
MKKGWSKVYSSLATLALIVAFHGVFFNALLKSETISLSSLNWLSLFDCQHYHHFVVKYGKASHPNWRQSAVVLANSDADIAYQLANDYHQKNQTNSALLWFKHASKLGHSEAAAFLANYWFEQNKLLLAKQQALLYPDKPWSLILSVELALSNGDLKTLTQLTPRLAEFPLGQKLIQELRQYSIFSQPIKQAVRDYSDCLTITFFATNLHDLRYANRLIEQVSKTFVGQQFCISKPRYIPLSVLSCDKDTDTAIRCDESRWHEKLTEIDSRYLAVMLPNGGANVHFGILYLDSNDDVNVFRHELLHLLGFVDEYQLPDDHEFCQLESNTIDKINVAVMKNYYKGEQAQVRKTVMSKLPWRALIKSTTPVVHKFEDGWQLGTPAVFAQEVGIFPAKTCRKGNTFMSVKPLQNWSTLEYFELALPKTYQQLVSQLSRYYRMPSFHFNVGQALLANDEKEKASAWIEKASKYADLE